MKDQIARTLADSVIEDAPIRLAAWEWATFRLYLIEKFKHTSMPNPNSIEIDNSWTRPPSH